MRLAPHALLHIAKLKTWPAHVKTADLVERFQVSFAAASRIIGGRDIPREWELLDAMVQYVQAEAQKEKAMPQPDRDPVTGRRISFFPAALKEALAAQEVAQTETEPTKENGSVKLFLISFDKRNYVVPGTTMTAAIQNWNKFMSVGKEQPMGAPLDPEHARMIYNGDQEFIIVGSTPTQA